MLYRSILVCVCFLTFRAFCQLAIVSGSGPAFPKQVDSISFIVHVEKNKNRIDTLIIPIDTGFFSEFKHGIDSTIHYVDAVRLKRREIAGSTRGIKFDAYLRFSYANTPVMKVFFCGRRFDGALLDVKIDKFPFVVTFKPEFVHKLDSIAAGLKKKAKTSPRPSATPLRPERGKTQLIPLISFGLGSIICFLFFSPSPGGEGAGG